MGKEPQYRAGDASPALFSFVKFRREQFGSILFNPFLEAEVELDGIATMVAGMCTGEYSLDGIGGACSAAFNLSGKEAGRKVRETLERLEGLCALHFVEKKAQFPRPLPEFRSAPATTAWFCAPKSIIWDVTYRCNLKCPHCLTDSGRRHATELETKDAFRLIDRFAEAKVLTLTLSGGEPFLRRDILDIVRRIADSGMSVNIASNGFNIPEKILKGLRDLPVFQIQVSIDGMGKSHDEFRGKAGAFEKSCNTLRRLKEEGLTTSISTTATAKNIHQLDDLIDLAISLDCSAFKAIPFIPAGRGQEHDAELWLGREGSLALGRTLADKSRTLGDRIAVFTESTFLFLLDPPSSSSLCDGAMACSAGYDSLSVGADGTAYPCPFLRGFPLGNLLVDPMEDIWHKSPVLGGLRTLKKAEMIGACATCDFAPAHCRGGCRAAAHFAYGTLKGADPLCFKDLVAGEARGGEVSP